MANIWQTGMRKEGSFWEGVNPAVHSFDEHVCRSVFCCTWMDDNPVISIPSPEAPFNLDFVVIGYSGDWSDGTLHIRYVLQNKAFEGDVVVEPKYGTLEPYVAPKAEFDEEDNPIYTPVFIEDVITDTDSYVQIPSGEVEYVNNWTVKWVGGKGLSDVYDFIVSIPQKP